jgi:hypothetical protein
VPLVRSIAILGDGWAVATSNGVSHAFTSGQLTAAQKLDAPANIEPVVNALMAAAMPGCFCQVHLTSVVPLQGVLVCANDASFFTGSWWL